MPRSMRPVATVPRPLIENTSSTAIRNGLSMSRTGSGISRVERRRAARSIVSSHFASPLQRRQRRAADDRRVVAVELVLAQELADFHLHQVEHLRVFHRVALVQEHDDVVQTDLTREQHVLARLRHHAVERAHHQDRAVHLRRAGDHVLDVVGVAGAVDVRVVALRRSRTPRGHRDRHRLRLVADVPPLAMSAYLIAFARPFFDCTFTSAAVSVVLPWSM